MQQPPIFLGIETSCDETAVALIQGRQVLAQALYSQIAEHQAFGGVVPNIAAGAHFHVLPTVAQEVLGQVPGGRHALGGIAVTAGPGLVGGLLVGLMLAKGLAISLQKPLWAVHHLEAHALMARMEHDICFPYLLLLVSGGHCLVAIVEAVGQYRVLGQTLDDAVGECVDKVARALGEGYPGGPAVERLAAHGSPQGGWLPIPLRGDKTCNFSFSGLKTASIQWIHRAKAGGSMDEQTKQDFCATLQESIAQTLRSRLENGLAQARIIHPSLGHVVLSGGVAANAYFRRVLAEVAEGHGKTFYAPPPSQCTDNGIMIAWSGYEAYRAGIPPNLSCGARPSWPLGELSTAMRRQ